MAKKRITRQTAAAAFAVLLLVAALFVINQNPFKYPCLGKGEEAETDCLERVLERAVNRKGVPEAFALLSNHRGKSSSLEVDECHLLAHLIGDKAFRLYERQGGINFGEKNDGSLCNFGFYHAFMTSFILTGRHKDADHFCETVSLGDDNLASSCYHGIGHGAIYTLTDDLRTTGTFSEMVAKGEEVCKKILENDFYKTEHCMRGIYGGISDILVFREHNMGNMSLADYYNVCSFQKEEFRPVCYQEMSVILHAAFGEGFEERVQFVVDSQIENEYKKYAIDGLVSLFPAVTNNKNWQDGIKVCKSLQAELEDLCFSALTVSTYRNAPEGDAKELLEEFCAYKLLAAEEKEECKLFITENTWQRQNLKTKS